jgi:hypothetical protein
MDTLLESATVKRFKLSDVKPQLAQFNSVM